MPQSSAMANALRVAGRAVKRCCRKLFETDGTFVSNRHNNGSLFSMFAVQAHQCGMARPVEPLEARATCNALRRNMAGKYAGAARHTRMSPGSLSLALLIARCVGLPDDQALADGAASMCDDASVDEPFSPVTPQHTPEQQLRVATEIVLFPPRRSNSTQKKIKADLGHQVLRPIDPAADHAAKERGIPMEHAPRTAADLCRERREILTFLSKQLRKDPRTPPSEYVVATDHLNACVGCKIQQAARAVLHDAETRDVGTELQWLVDDHVLHRWRNTIRFLNPPTSQQVVLRPPSDDVSTRFGCPCSAVGAPDGGVYLWHAGKLKNGTKVAHPRRPGDKSWPTLDEHAILMRKSPDGIRSWSVPEELDLRASPKVPSTHVFRQFSVAVQPAADALNLGAHSPLLRNASALLIAGYEGRNAEACLAVSRDGVRWRPLSARGKDGTRLYKDLVCPGPGAGQRGAEKSMFGRAADSSVVPVVDEKLKRDMVWHRKDFGTPHGWREIRGVQLQTLNRRFADLPSLRESNVSRRVLASWYLDRQGKLERFRRQIYSLSLAPHGRDLWLGLMTVVEWAKDTTVEPEGDELPAFERDTTQVYLVTSRDGVHVDDGWVYAHRPLVVKGAKQSDWDSGLLLPAPQIVSDENGHLVYFEARKAHHENRFTAQATIGASRWERHRIVGLRQAHADAPAVVVTKAFEVTGTSLHLEVDRTSSSGARVAVEVLTPDMQVLRGFDAAACAPLAAAEGGASGAVEVRWRGKSFADVRDRPVRLRFILEGGARLYTFEVRSV